MKKICLFLFVLGVNTGVFAQEGQDDKVIRKSIYFGGGSFYIDDWQATELRKFLQSIPKIENYEIGVFSHTDNIGGKEYNEWLSKMRSEAVIYELGLINVPKEMIKTKDWGQINPLYSNETHNGRLMNRRVDVVLWPITF